jgi:hypothetical protein
LRLGSVGCLNKLVHWDVEVGWVVGWVVPTGAPHAVEGRRSIPHESCDMTFMLLLYLSSCCRSYSSLRVSSLPVCPPACPLQMMPAVVPEDYPPEPPPNSAAAEHDGRLQAMHAAQHREQQLREQHHTDR